MGRYAGPRHCSPIRNAVFSTLSQITLYASLTASEYPLVMRLAMMYPASRTQTCAASTTKPARKIRSPSVRFGFGAAPVAMLPGTDSASAGAISALDSVSRFSALRSPGVPPSPRSLAHYSELHSDLRMSSLPTSKQHELFFQLWKTGRDARTTKGQFQLRAA